MLGDYLIRSQTADHRGRRLRLARRGWREAVRRTLVWHERIEDVVDQGGHGERVDRLEGDRQARLGHVAQCRRPLR